jgi:hypothetical protein
MMSIAIPTKTTAIVKMIFIPVPINFLFLRQRRGGAPARQRLCAAALFATLSF